jgi:hypothetical protein
MAVAREGDDASLLYLRCDDERVFEVVVQEIGRSRGGRPTGPVLWRIRSESGVGIDSLRLGEAPGGFTTVVPLEVPLPEHEKLVVLLQTSVEEEVAVEFRLSELSADSVQVYYGRIAREEFSTNRAQC